jgi:putative toxin-antitoxin system antitoxin component (TIGR02293 family)
MSRVEEAQGKYRPQTLAQSVQALTAAYGITEADLAEVLDVTRRTIMRWKDKNETLSVQKRDLLHILESITLLGQQVLGSQDEVKQWLHSPVLSLDGQKPVDILKTESGRRRIENVLRQIEAGVY